MYICFFLVAINLTWFKPNNKTTSIDVPSPLYVCIQVILKSVKCTLILHVFFAK